MRRIIIVCSMVLAVIGAAYGQAANASVEKVYVVFKTHLDVGFTDLSSVVTQRYVSLRSCRQRMLPRSMFGQRVRGSSGSICRRLRRMM